MADPADALGLGESPPHDYGPRDPRRWRAPWSTRAVAALTALGALVVGFLVATGLSAGREVVEAQDARKDELLALIGERIERTEELSSELDELRERVDETEDVVFAGVEELNREVEELELAAGLTDLAGPGVVLVLDDARDPCPQQPADCRIQDVDLQLAINTLFAAGAEAVAVNDQRVLSVTAVRSAGQTVLVNRQVLTPPYELVALGDREALEQGVGGSPLAADFAAWRDEYGLRFDLEGTPAAEVPGYRGSVRLELAEPVAPAVGEDAVDQPRGEEPR
ncbi:MAG: DUF881 domain-containing protein [Actinomycetota bacterium]